MAATPLHTPTRPPTSKPPPDPSSTPLVTPSPTLTHTPYLTVSDEQVNVYAGPGEMYEILGQLRRGARLPILGRSEDGVWFQVDYLGWRGWVAVQSVAVDVSPSGASYSGSTSSTGQRASCHQRNQHGLHRRRGV